MQAVYDGRFYGNCSAQTRQPVFVLDFEKYTLDTSKIL